MYPNRVPITVILLFTFVLVSCKEKAAAPSAPAQITIEINQDVISNKALGAIGGPGFYTSLITPLGYQNPLWGDTVVHMLLDSNVAVEELWYPELASMCLDPFQHERQIVKLLLPDTRIKNLGYDTLRAGYQDFCLQSWRHYKVRRVVVGS